MKKSDLKKIIKPIVKECIIESLVEEGILSGIISEVVKGINPVATLVENTPAAPVEAKEDLTQLRLQEEAKENQRKRLEEHRQKMLAAVNADAYGGVDLFEGTTPLTTSGTPGDSAANRSPLGNVNPTDPGIDITKLAGMSGIWKELVK